MFAIKNFNLAVQKDQNEWLKKAWSSESAKQWLRMICMTLQYYYLFLSERDR